MVAGTEWNLGTVAEVTSKLGSLKVNHLKWKLSLLTTLMTLLAQSGADNGRLPPSDSTSGASR